VTVPLVTPPGVNSMTPDLALNYRSGSSSFWPGGPMSADGQAWAHWQVSGFSWIGACTEKTLQYGYTEPKPGLCVKNGGREVAMVFVSDESGTYYIPDVLDRDMAADTRLYSELNGNDGTYGEYRYRLERRDKGTVTYFKKHSGMPDVGLISYKVDRFGNSMAYEWVSPGIRPNLRRPKSIVYGDGHLKVSLEWSPLPTPLTAVSHELNIPSSATKYSYHMVNELAQGNTIIGLGEVALCPGSHYSACKRKLELEYGLVSNGTNGMGMGGLSKVIQPMANNIENSHIVESYISYVSGDKVTIGSVSDSKVRGRRVNVNRKGKRGHRDDGIL